MKIPATAPRVLLFVAVLMLAGCGDREGKGADAGEPKNPVPHLLPPEDAGARIVLEAEDGTLDPPMVVESFRPFRHPKLGLEQASGGKCILVPKDANKECMEKKVDPKGKVTLTFRIPKDGRYYISPRVLWQGGCWNSFGMLLDGRSPIHSRKNPTAPLDVTDSTFKHWHWIKFNSPDETSLAPRAFKLTEGKHTLTFTNREDDVRLDQVYITDDPDDAPAGIKKAE